MSAALDPETVVAQLAGQLPIELHEHVLLVGSLAAAYHYREVLEQHAVNTKDADVVVQPAGDLATCQSIANKLLEQRWIPTTKADHPVGTSKTPLEQLPVVRLRPPESAADSYFVELLALPLATQTASLAQHRCVLTNGHWIVPSFRFMALVQHAQRKTTAGLRYAAPATMALANLLAHPTLGDATMSESHAGVQRMKRSAKDLGRVLGLARLAAERDELDEWLDVWAAALRDCFSTEAHALATRAPEGLRALLGSPTDFAHALRSLGHGILRGSVPTPTKLEATAEQVLDLLTSLPERVAR